MFVSIQLCICVNTIVHLHDADREWWQTEGIRRVIEQVTGRSVPRDQPVPVRTILRAFLLGNLRAKLRGFRAGVCGGSSARFDFETARRRRAVRAHRGNSHGHNRCVSTFHNGYEPATS